MDAVLAIEEHIDPSLMRPVLDWEMDEEEEWEEDTTPVTEYDDLWGLDEEKKEEPARKKRRKNSRPSRKRISFYLSNSIAGSCLIGNGIS